MRRAQRPLLRCLRACAEEGPVTAWARPPQHTQQQWQRFPQLCHQRRSVAQPADAVDSVHHAEQPQHPFQHHQPPRHLQQHHAARALILDGRQAAADWTATLAAEVAEVTAAINRPPGLAVVLVGERPDSLLYVARKQEACERAGVAASIHHLPASISQGELESVVAGVCADAAVDGVLVQLPLPRHLDEEGVMQALDPRKDVDGFHPLNMGRMLMRGRTPRFVPCTPMGVMQLLERHHLDVHGRTAVVLGDSNVVGTPLSVLLRDRGAAAVTVCHRPALSSYQEWLEMVDEERLQLLRVQAAACLPRLPGPRPQGPAAGTARQWLPAEGTRPQQQAQQQPQQPNAPGGSCMFQAHQLPTITRTADVLVVAVGHPEMVRADWVKPGAIVIDVGINVVSPSAGPDVAPASVARGGSSGMLQSGSAPHQQQQPPLEQQRHQQHQQQQHQQHQHQHQQQQQQQHQHFPAALVGYKVVGDVAFEEVSQVASAITPVPGGVGPMTIAAVLHNTVRAAQYNAGLLPW